MHRLFSTQGVWGRPVAKKPFCERLGGRGPGLRTLDECEIARQQGRGQEGCAPVKEKEIEQSNTYSPYTEKEHTTTVSDLSCKERRTIRRGMVKKWCQRSVKK